MLKIQVFDMGGNRWHGGKASPITVHSNGEGRGAVTLVRTRRHTVCSVCILGAIKVSLALPVMCPGVPAMAENEGNQGRQKENHLTHDGRKSLKS